MWAAVQSDLNPKYHTGYFTGLSTISSIVNLYSIHCKFGWQNLLRKTTNQIDLKATAPNCFHIRLSPGFFGTYRAASSQAPDMAVVDSCHMPQAIATFPKCVMSSVLKDEVFHVAFPRLIPANMFFFQKSLSEAHGPKWRLDCGIWRMMTHHLISMSPRHPLKYTLCRNFSCGFNLGTSCLNCTSTKDSSMDLLLQWYQATLQAQEISVKSFKITEHLVSITHRIHGVSIYIYHKSQPNIGNYAIHGSYGYMHRKSLPKFF